MPNTLLYMKFTLIYFLFLFFVPIHLSACLDSSEDADETVSSAVQTHSSDSSLELPKEIISNTYFFDLNSIVSSTLSYSSFILIGSLVIGSLYCTYPYLGPIGYAIKNIVNLFTPGYNPSPDDEFFLGLTAFLYKNGMPKVKTISYFPDPSDIIKSVPVDNALSNCSEIVNPCIDTVVSTNTILSSSSESIAPIISVLDTILDVASK